MAANPINIVNRLHAVQYDGTNSSDIVALDIFDFNNDDETGGVWTFQSPPDGTLRTVNTDDWILYSQNAITSVASNVEFVAQFSCNALCEIVEEVAMEVENLALAPKVQAVGVAPVPTLVLNATANIDVTLQPAMADASYDAYAHKFAGVSLANLNITSVTVVDEDTVTVGVQNTGLVTLAGASILVHAVA